MNKKLISMVICILALVGLTAVYFIIKNNNEQNADSEELTQDETIYLIERNRTEIEFITLNNQDLDFKFLPTDDERSTWEIEGMEHLNILATPINSIAISFGTLTAFQKLEADSINLEEFGFSSPLATATAKYTDGTMETLVIGALTSDRQYAYIMRDGDESIYLIHENTSRRFTRTMDELIDKTLPGLTTEQIIYLYVNQRDHDITELAYMGEEDGMIEIFENFGSLGMHMIQPFEGREVYTTNLDLSVTTNLSTISLDRLVELEPNDYSKYGLDEPELEIKIKGVYGDTLHLYVGNSTGDGYRYCRIEGRDEVFTISTSNIEPFLNIDVFKFIARFVALINIATVDRIVISSDDLLYTLNTNHGIIPATEEGGSDTEIITPTINGILIEDSPFRKAYSSIISISYDTAIEPTPVEGDPALTITFELNTGEPDVVIKLHEYNNDFYMIEEEDGIANFVANKITVRTMFETINELIE